MSSSAPPPDPSQQRPSLRAPGHDGSGPRRSSRFSGFRLADIRPGEGRFVVGSSATLAGIIAAHVSLETARDALFLTELGARELVWVYMIMAVLVAAMGRLSASVDRLLGRSNALILTLMLAALGTTIFYVAGRSPELTFAFYLWVGVTGTLLLLQFWLFAAARFTVAQGRRLFGLIAAGGVLGAVAGGALSTLLTRFFPVESLLAMALVLHLATALLITTAPAASTLSTSSRRASWNELRGAMRRNPYVKRIALLTVLSTATLLFVDYAFKAVTQERIAEANLARFLAMYYMGINAAALLIQVVMAMRVLQRAGTVLSLSILPLTLIVTAGAPLIFGGALAGAILTRGAEGSLRHSLHKVSFELLFLPLESRQRTVAKSLMESFVARMTQGLAALGLLLLGKAGLDQPKVLLAAVVIGAALWLATALSLRRPYLAQFRSMMGREEGRARFHLDELSLDSVEVVIESLSSSQESEVLGAMALFEEAKRTRIIPALLLYHPSEAVLLRALSLVPSRDRKDWPALAERLLSHPSLQVRLAAARALGRNGLTERLDPDRFEEPELVAVSAFYQADRLSDPTEHEKIAALLRAQPSHEDSAAELAILNAISDHGSKRWADFLLRLHAPRDLRQARHLADAMARVRDPRFVAPLIEMLRQRTCIEGARRALLSIGTPALEALMDMAHRPGTDDAFQKNLIVTIGQFDVQAAADYLINALHESRPGGVRYKALVALCSMLGRSRFRVNPERLLPLVTENGEQYLVDTLILRRIEGSLASMPLRAQPTGQLLLGLLRDKRRQSIERMTRLLQLMHPRENLRRVYHAVTGRDPAAKAAAAELVEVLTLGNDETLREIVRTVMDATGTLGREEHLSLLLGIEFRSLSDAIGSLLRSNDPALSAIAAEFAKQAGLSEVDPLIDGVLEQNPWLLNPKSSPVRSLPRGLLP